MDIVLPTHVRVIDSGTVEKVDMNEMWLDGDSGRACLRLNKAVNSLTVELSKPFKLCILHALDSRRKVSTVINWVNVFRLFVNSVENKRGCKCGTIRLDDYLAFTRIKNASQVKLLRSVILYWNSLDIPGIATDLVDYLKTTRPPKPRTTTEIQNSEEKERPFTLEDTRVIIQAINELYEEGEFSTQDNLLWKLLISEGMRPSQIHRLQIGDWSISRNEVGSAVHARVKVSIPKQSGTSARSYQIETSVADSTAEAADDHLKYLSSIFGGETKSSDIPIICVKNPWYNRPEIARKGLNIQAQINKVVSKLCSSVKNLDEKDLFSRRFKHTKLTHLASLGASLDILARAGFQTSNVSLQHYVNLSDEAFAEFEEAMSPYHEFIADSFRGKIIDRQDREKPENTNDLFMPEAESSVGSCSATPCGVIAPFGCYLCRMYRAFKDGPHQLVLDYLLRQRALREEMDLPEESIRRDDHLIAAVRFVISKIRKLEDE